MKKDDERVHTAQAAYQSDTHLFHGDCYIAFANCDLKSMCSPAVLSMSPCIKKLDEEKVYIWRFGSVKWFWPSIFAHFSEAGKRHSKA